MQLPLLRKSTSDLGRILLQNPVRIKHRVLQQNLRKSRRASDAAESPFPRLVMIPQNLRKFAS